MDDTLDWMYDPNTMLYWLTLDEFRCYVWRIALAGWAVILTRNGVSTAAVNFGTAEEAKAWCEEQIANP